LNTLSALLEVRKLLDKSSSWCRGEEALTSLGGRIRPNCPAAISWSIVGAVSKVCDPLRDSACVITARAMNTLFHCLPHMYRNQPAPDGSLRELLDDVALAEWNDGVATHEDVICLLDKALAKERMSNKEETFEALNLIVDECHDTSNRSGWWDKYQGKDLSPEEIASKLCLVHSEVSEALEEVREANLSPYYTLNVNGSDETVIVPGGTVNAKPEGLPSELADVIIRVFDLCGYMGVDIVTALRVKMDYNKTRSHRHGGKQL